jgi:hypothetical protein
MKSFEASADISAPPDRIWASGLKERAEGPG